MEERKDLLPLLKNQFGIATSIYGVSVLDEGPLIIVEHDSKLMKPLPDMTKEGYKFLSYSSEYQYHMAIGSGYYLTPPVAERLVANAVSREININSDGFIGNMLNFDAQQKMKDYYYIDQICFDGLNTIDHKSPKRTYIGLDYEDIDIPSIHGQA